MRTNLQRRITWLAGAIGAGCAFQVASCADLGAETVAGLLSSISGQLIRNTVNDVLGLSGGGFGLFG